MATSDQARKDIEKQFKLILKYWEEQTSEAVLNLYTETAAYLPDDQPTVTGRQALREVFKAEILIYQKVVAKEFEYFDLTSDTTAVINTTISLVDVQDETKVLNIFSTTMLWKKVNGTWLVDKEQVTARNKSAEILQKESVRATIETRHESLMKAILAGDEKVVSSAYAENVTLQLKMEEPIHGREAAVKSAMKFADKPLKYTCEIQHFEMLNDKTCFIIYYGDVLKESSFFPRKVRETVMWKKGDDDQWYIHFLTYNDRSVVPITTEV